MLSLWIPITLVTKGFVDKPLNLTQEIELGKGRHWVIGLHVLIMPKKKEIRRVN